MIEWLTKDWYLKLFDVSIVLFLLLGISFIAIFTINSLKKIGNPVFTKEGKKLTFSLIDSDGNTKKVSTDELIKIVQEKDEEIRRLNKKLEDVQNRLSFLEREIQKSKIVEEYKEQHRIPLTEHAVFFNLKKNIEAGINFDYGIDNPAIRLKQEIASLFLEKCKLPIFYNRLKEYVAQFEKYENEGECLALLYTIITKLYEWIDEYSNKALDYKVELSDGRTFYGIPKVFINKFNEWHEPHIQIVVHKIKDVLYNEFYNSWQLKLIVILDHIDTAFYLTIQDAEKSISTLNGELEKELKQKIENFHKGV